METTKPLSKDEKLKIFQSLFKGRDDVFAQRWESPDGNRSAYYPVHADREKTAYMPLSEKSIEDHLRGHRIIGVYPILKDNSTLFVAADFDGARWQEDVLALFDECTEYGLPSYVERSRSGDGAHVWWFLENAYPAYKSRKIFLKIIKEAGLIDTFDKEESFDRLFPNQDYLTKKGLGNLIALPLQAKARESGNSVFIDIKDFKQFEDQWAILQSVQRISIEELDNLYEQLAESKSQIPADIVCSSDTIPVVIGSTISIPKNCLTPALISFLTDKLNFFNSEWAIKHKMGLPTYDLEKYFKTIDSDDDKVYIPRGFQHELTQYMGEQNIKFSIINERPLAEKIKLKPSFELFDYQEEAVSAILKNDGGVLVAPPGAGKTIIGISAISKLAQPALIIVHRKQIFDQWIERIENFLNIPKKKIGQIVSSKKSIKLPITVAMVQSLSKLEDYSELAGFGTVIVDECHHVPAKMFRSVITKINPYYLYGLTATPIRKHNDEKLIFIYLGPIIHTVIKKQSTIIVSGEEKPLLEHKAKDDILDIRIKETNLSFPFKIATKNYQSLSKALIYDTNRNELIVSDVIKEVSVGMRCLILTERKEHAEMLNLYLKKDYETIVLTGDLGIKQKRQREKQIQSGHYQVIIATGQLVGEGTHFENINCLFLVYPLSFKGKLLQYLGRILHSKESLRSVYDYRDLKIDYLDKMFKKRKKFYDELENDL